MLLAPAAEVAMTAVEATDTATPVATVVATTAVASLATASASAGDMEKRLTVMREGTGTFVGAGVGDGASNTHVCADSKL